MLSIWRAESEYGDEIEGFEGIIHLIDAHRGYQRTARSEQEHVRQGCEEDLRAEREAEKRFRLELEQLRQEEERKREEAYIHRLRNRIRRAALEEQERRAMDEQERQFAKADARRQNQNWRELRDQYLEQIALGDDKKKDRMRQSDVSWKEMQHRRVQEEHRQEMEAARARQALNEQRRQVHDRTAICPPADRR